MKISPHPSAGFSLVELLVVIAIMAVIAGLLLPALTKGKQRAYTANCTGNLRQLGVALQLHLQEEKSFPLATSGDGLGAWQRALRPLAGEKILNCPQSVKPSDEFRQIFPSIGEQINPHYGYNFIGSVKRNPPPKNLGLGGDYVFDGSGGYYAPTKENQVVLPARMIAFADSAAFLRPRLSSLPSVTPADPLYVTFPFIFPSWGYYGVGKSHNGSANILFCDGHIEFGKQTLWMEDSEQQKRLWNNDYLPHKETW